MSSVVIAGSTSGTVTLQAAPTAGATTVTFAPQTGTVVASPPLFWVYPSSVLTVTNNTLTLVPLDSVTYDTNNNYSTVLDRYTPTVAGFYQINANLSVNSTTSLSSVLVSIYRNGLFGTSANVAPGSPTSAAVSVSNIIYLNGVDDFVSMYARVSGTGTLTVTTSSTFSGVLVRAA